MDAGIQQANRQAPPNPLPVSWLGRADSPSARPDWAIVPALTAIQQQNLLGQMSYVISEWDYKKIGANNELGRYQFNSVTLEQYGLIVTGSNNSYGTDSVNYQHCWRPAVNTYAEYLVDMNSLIDFISSSAAQEGLANQLLADLYNSAVRINAIQGNDSAETVAGMLYVCWQLGVGSPANSANPSGTGAWSWRYFNVGTGAPFYNAGRYAVAVLSK
jgi:hypothetical protein